MLPKVKNGDKDFDLMQQQWAKQLDPLVRSMQRGARVITTNGDDPGVGGLSTNILETAVTSSDPTTYTEISNMRSALTTSDLGNPVQILFQSYGTLGNYVSAIQGNGLYKLVRSADIAVTLFELTASRNDEINGALIVPPTIFNFLDIEAQPNTHYTYTLWFKASPTTTLFQYTKMLVFET